MFCLRYLKVKKIYKENLLLIRMFDIRFEESCEKISLILNQKITKDVKFQIVHIIQFLMILLI